MGKTSFGIMLSLLLVGMLASAYNIRLVRAEPKTITVPDDYPTIQQAITNAVEGDTIFVRSGMYYENLIVSKMILLIGENKTNTIIDGYYLYEQSVVSITADNVWISGFTIRDGWCGISVSSSGCTIVENRIINNRYQGGGDQIIASGRGIWLKYSKNATITENIVEHNDRNISLKGAENSTIESNTILSSLVSWGIVLEGSSNNTIRNNIVKYSVYDGIYLAGSSNNNISGNSVTDNGDEGVYLGSSNNNILIGNTVTNNPGIGIWLDWSSGNTIVGNNVTNNKKYGINAWQSGNTAVYHNNFINNSWGQAYSSLMNTWDDGYPSGGNYWSDYTGIDMYHGPNQNEAGSDGIGDTQYNIDVDNVDHYPLMNPYVSPPPFKYALTIITANGGTTTPIPATHNYEAGSLVQVAAIPNANYLFDHWELDGLNVGSATPYVVVMNKNHTLKAIFRHIPPPANPVGGYATLIEEQRAVNPLTLYLAATTILATACTVFRHKRRAQPK